MDSIKNAELSELIDMIRCGSFANEAFSELLDRYSPLLKKRVTTYFGALSVDESEPMQEASIALHSAAMTYDSDKCDGVTFGLYAQVCLRRRLLDLIKGERRRGEHEEDFDVERISVDSGILSRLVREEERLWLHSSARQLLSSLEYSVFSLWLSGLKTADIAEELSLEAKAVDNAKSRILKKLRDGLPQHRSDD